MVINNYEINSTTYALIPENKKTTKVIEADQELSLESSVNKILDYSCAYYGSSFKGRLKGSKYALGSKYKLPIIVEETREMIFFPTTSYENEDCIWLSLNGVLEYKKEDNNTVLKFKNNKTITLPISYESFENQILRASRLLLILKSRKNNQSI